MTNNHNVAEMDIVILFSVRKIEAINAIFAAYEKASRLVYGSNEHMLALRTADDMRYAFNQNEAA
jgi:hypothetical protein